MKKDANAKVRELTDAELAQVSGGVANQPPFGGPQGGGPGNSGNGDKHGAAVGPGGGNK